MVLYAVRNAPGALSALIDYGDEEVARGSKFFVNLYVYALDGILACNESSAMAIESAVNVDLMVSKGDGVIAASLVHILDFFGGEFTVTHSGVAVHIRLV